MSQFQEQVPFSWLPILLTLAAGLLVMAMAQWGVQYLRFLISTSSNDRHYHKKKKKRRSNHKRPRKAADSEDSSSSEDSDSYD